MLQWQTCCWQSCESVNSTLPAGAFVEALLHAEGGMNSMTHVASHGLIKSKSTCHQKQS